MKPTETSIIIILYFTKGEITWYVFAMIGPLPFSTFVLVIFRSKLPSWLLRPRRKTWDAHFEGHKDHQILAQIV